jgi:S-adenosylmethionine decarboxylase proenzyme
LKESALQTRGQHLLIEFRGCKGPVLNDPDALQALMERAVEATRATIVNSVFHVFAPQGVTGVVVVEESHFSIHTWPEHGYVAVDVYTCGDCHPQRAREVLRAGLAASSTESMLIERGLGLPAGDIKIAAHDIEQDAQAVPRQAAAAG